VTTQATPQAAGATLHLGGDAYCTPDLQSLLAPADSVSLYPGNARRHDQERITSSLADLGCHRALNAQRSTGHCLVGNGMLRGLLDLGATQVPVTWRDCTDAVAREVVVRDNRTGDLATDDPADLIALLDALASDGADLARIGYDPGDRDALDRALANEQFVADALTAGVPLSELSPPIDVDGDTSRVTVTVETDHRADLYALLAKKPWVRDVADAHTRKPPG
jgi:hypothetical protein